MAFLDSFSRSRKFFTLILQLIFKNLYIILLIFYLFALNPKTKGVVPFKMDFNYVVQRQEKTKVCFGSGLERELLSSDRKGLVSKFARTYSSEVSDIGPGSYDIIKQTSALSKVMDRPTSNLGTVLGGRTAARKDITDDKSWVPGPQYDIPTTFPNEFKQSCAPFNSTEERSKYQTSDVPGVGIYKLTPCKRKRMAFAHSFGGPKCLIPAVKMKCGPFNYDTCERCKEFPEGDYWYLDMVEAENVSELKKSKEELSQGLYLCRPCYDLEKKEHTIFSVQLMRKFKKIRDCSKVHFHDGCKAKLFLVSPQDIEKVKEREGYLSLYFS